MSKKMNISSMENIMNLTEKFVKERHDAEADYVMVHIDDVGYSREFKRTCDLGVTQRVLREGEYCDRHRYAVKGNFTLISGKRKFRGYWFGYETVTVSPDGTESESWIQPDSEFVDVYGVRYHLQ